MGIRADESMVRLQSVTRKTVDNYITKPTSDVNNVRIVKPIYDWTEKDVFRYFYDQKIAYCPTYDIQLFAGKQLRVATALVAVNAKEFDRVRKMYPVFYEQIISIFPDMLLQERYYKDLDKDAIFDQYPHTFGGILQYIDDAYPDRDKREKYKGFVKNCISIRAKKVDSTNLGGYPVLHVFKAVRSGNKQMIQAKIKPSPKDYAYEGLPFPGSVGSSLPAPPEVHLPGPPDSPGFVGVDADNPD